MSLIGVGSAGVALGNNTGNTPPPAPAPPVVRFNPPTVAGTASTSATITGPPTVSHGELMVASFLRHMREPKDRKVRDHKDLAQAYPWVAQVDEKTQKAIVATMKAMNGDRFYWNEEGEKEEDNPLYRVSLPRGDYQDGCLVPTDQELFIQRAIAKEQLAATKLTARQLDIIAVVRTLAAEEGLLKPGVSANNYHARYNEAVFRDKDVDPIPFTDLTPMDVDHIRHNFRNLVCSLAYFVRRDGHHFTKHIEEQVLDKWSKVVNAEPMGFTKEDFGVVFTYGLHAVIASVLDAYWAASARDGSCAACWILRFAVPGAGQASAFATLAGLQDLRTMNPRFLDLHGDSMKRLQRIVAELSKPENRWVGTINHNQHGAPAAFWKESEFVALSAAVKGMQYRLTLGEEKLTELGKSKSLTRNAGGAGLTEAMFKSLTIGVISALGEREKAVKYGSALLDTTVGAGRVLGEPHE